MRFRAVSAALIGAMTAIVLLFGSSATAEAAFITEDRNAMLEGKVSQQAQYTCTAVLTTGVSAGKFKRLLVKNLGDGMIENEYPKSKWSTVVSKKQRTVTMSGSGGSLPAPVSVTIKWIPGFGCVPLKDGGVAFATTPVKRDLSPAGAAKQIAWPKGDRVVSHRWQNQAGGKAIKAEVKKLFTDPTNTDSRSPTAGRCSTSATALGSSRPL